jgi:hypothetical protein
VVDIVEQQVERADPLDNPALDLSPFRGREDPRDRVERQDAVDRIALGIDREGDAEIVERLLGGGGAAPEIVGRSTRETLAQLGGRRAPQHLAIEPLRVVAVEHELAHSA